MALRVIALSFSIGRRSVTETFVAHSESVLRKRIINFEKEHGIESKVVQETETIEDELKEDATMSSDSVESEQKDEK